MSEYERNYAMRDAHVNAAEDAYFTPRPVDDGAMQRKAFRAGFERGWDAAAPAAPAEDVASALTRLAAERDAARAEAEELRELLREARGRGDDGP